MGGAFDAGVRVLICENCGAALPAAPAGGGQIQCPYCRTVSVVAARNDAALSRREPVDEAQRVAHLWSQIHSGLLVHDAVPKLTEHNMLPEKNLAAAMKLWEETRKRQAVDPASVGDDLLFLTGAIVGYFALQGDTVKVRALWESALDSCHQPRQQQFIRGSLCRLAAKEGDVAAAEAWLRPCDPQSDDLLCDTSYRLSYSYMATTKGDYTGVLDALGRTTDALPFFFTSRALCHVLRANAFEKLGDVETASAQIQALVDADPTMRMALPAMAKSNPTLNLCPQSFARALRS